MRSGLTWPRGSYLHNASSGGFPSFHDDITLSFNEHVGYCFTLVTTSVDLDSIEVTTWFLREMKETVFLWVATEQTTADSRTIIDREGTKFVRLSEFESSTIFEVCRYSKHLKYILLNSKNEEMIVNYTSVDSLDSVWSWLHYAMLNFSSFSIIKTYSIVFYSIL